MAAPQAVTKPVPRVAMIGLDEPTQATLNSCLGQFGAMGVALDASPPDRLIREKFEGCAIRLDERYRPYLDALRVSRLNGRVVVYGFGAGPEGTKLGARYRVDAMLGVPVEREVMLKFVRASRALLASELRHCTRMPFASEIRMMSNGTWYKARSEELSAGGMRLKSDFVPRRYTSVIVSLDLPEQGKISMAGQIWWTDAHGRIGVRFAHADPERESVREWIERRREVA